MPTGEGIIAHQRILDCVMTKMAALLVLVLAPQGETYNRPDRRSPGGQGALEGLARAIGPFRAVVLVAHVHMIDDSSIDVYVLCMIHFVCGTRGRTTGTSLCLRSVISRTEPTAAGDIVRSYSRIGSRPTSIHHRFDCGIADRIGASDERRGDEHSNTPRRASCLALFDYSSETSPPSERLLLLFVLIACGLRLRRTTHARGCRHVALRVHTHGRL